MSMDFLDLKTREAWKLLAPFIAVLSLGCLGHWLCKHEYPWWDFGFALTDALMVAGVIGFCFELFAHHFLISQVSGELTEKLLGQGLPEELQQQIKSMVDT